MLKVKLIQLLAKETKKKLKSQGEIINFCGRKHFGFLIIFVAFDFLRTIF